MISSPSLTSPFQAHKHQLCIDTALAAARQLCKKNLVKLTPTREQVLTIILQSHRPCGAYKILEQLAQTETLARKPAPPTVYRALEFLIKQRLIHRIASLNAYIACCRPARSHRAQFLICLNCEQVMELNARPIADAIAASASEQAFAVTHECIEVFGKCPQCLSHEKPA